MANLKEIERRLDNLYVSLSELKRYMILNLPPARPKTRRAWNDLMAASVEVSASWSGPAAVEEISSQREK